MKRAVVSFAVLSLLTAACGLQSVIGGNDVAAAPEADLLTAGERVKQCLENAPPEQPSEARVWLNVGIVESDIDAVDKVLRSAESVTTFTFVDVDATYDDFVDFYADEPEMAELVDPAQLPLSFDVEFARDDLARTTAAELETLTGVNEVEFAPLAAHCFDELAALAEICSVSQPEQADVLIWLEVNAEPADAERIERDLKAHTLLNDVTYIGPEASEAEFRAMFPDEPELMELVDMSVLPTSFQAVTVPLSSGQMDDLGAELAMLSPVIQDVEIVGQHSAICGEYHRLND